METAVKKILFAVTVALALVGCATQMPPGDDHTAHHPAGQPSAAGGAEEQMKRMQEMHQKMMGAKTPEERQALMAEHMKAMQGGMSMMCEMGRMMDGNGPPGGMSMPQAQERQQMMQKCMSMRDMTMRMMMDREAGQAPAPAK
jgi:hypothetical protein